MYDAEDTDLVVKYYDQAFALGSEQEVGWYIDRVRQFGGPVLDLACGTGRLAILLARAGYEVTGIDQSAGMLDQFARKLQKESPEVRQRIHTGRQPMAGFSLPDRFSTIVCCDAFFHNLTVEEEMACLGRVAHHLRPNGRFVFNLPHPTAAFILDAAESAGKTFTERGRYALAEGGDTLLVEQAQAGDEAAQTITTTLRITRYDAAGAIVEQGESTWTSRYLHRHEATHLLHRCGFEVEMLVGDYGGGPVTGEGQLIFQVRPEA